MGYAGGTTANPDYHHIGDHTETVQVDFDPHSITYAQLLDIFWRSHNPASQSWSRQYKHAVFYHDDRQRRQAEDSKAAVEKKTGRRVKTEIAPLRAFTMAEDYHQKYLLKQNYRLKADMTRIYPHHRDFVDSTAVARINGYAGGNGTKEQFEREIERLGLSAAGQQDLKTIVERQWDYDRQ